MRIFESHKEGKVLKPIRFIGTELGKVFLLSTVGPPSKIVGNRTQQRHIVTIEEPIEFVHENRKSYFTQREVGRDSPTFEKALRAATRQDPDVLLVGEMRDTETIAMAMHVAAPEAVDWTGSGELGLVVGVEDGSLVWLPREDLSW